jgi:hypothetical protein
MDNTKTMAHNDYLEERQLEVSVAGVTAAQRQTSRPLLPEISL